jgi:hypothetical protein
LTEDFDKDILIRKESEDRSQKTGKNPGEKKIETDVVMTKDKEKTIVTKRGDLDNHKIGKASFSSTLEMSPNTFIGKRKRRGFL